MNRKLQRLLIVGLLCAGGALFTQRAVAQHLEQNEEKATEEIEQEEEDLTVWKWANFAILAVGMGVMLSKMLPKAFAERTEAIQKDIKESAAMKADAERRAADVEKRVASLGADIETFKAQAAKDMASEGERIRLETTAQIQRIEAQASSEIETAGKIARRELRRYSAELALKLAEERVRNRMDAAAESGLVDNFVTELSRQSAEERKN